MIVVSNKFPLVPYPVAQKCDRAFFTTFKKKRHFFNLLTYTGNKAKKEVKL